MHIVFHIRKWKIPCAVQYGMYEQMQLLRAGVVSAQIRAPSLVPYWVLSAQHCTTCSNRTQLQNKTMDLEERGVFEVVQVRMNMIMGSTCAVC